MSNRARRAARVTLCAAATLAAARPDDRPTLWLVGDSTMADRPDPARNPEQGWGQALPRWLDTARVAVRNAAANGRSTRSFRAEGRWEAVRAALRPGDVVVIQFGHNDEKAADSTRYAAPDGDYPRNLARFVDEARAVGAAPVLATPIVRRAFAADGTLRETHGAYPDAVRAVAARSGVPLLDLHAATRALVTAAGPDASKALYVWLAAGENPAHPAEQRDDTHLSPRGAAAVARLAARALRAQGILPAAAVRDVD